MLTCVLSQEPAPAPAPRETRPRRSIRRTISANTDDVSTSEAPAPKLATVSSGLTALRLPLLTLGSSGVVPASSCRLSRKHPLQLNHKESRLASRAYNLRMRLVSVYYLRSACWYQLTWSRKSHVLVLGLGECAFPASYLPSSLSWIVLDGNSILLAARLQILR